MTNLTDNEIETLVSTMLAKREKVPDYLMERYKNLNKLKTSKDTGLI